MRDYSKFSDPNFNSAFRRRWSDDPLDERGLRHLGREVVPRVLGDVARRAIAGWLDKAAQTHDGKTAEAFRQADHIRRKLGLAWEDLIDHRRAA